MEKTTYSQKELLIGIALITLILGLLAGYFLMPQKVMTKTEYIASKCPNVNLTCPKITEVKCTNVKAPSCPKCPKVQKCPSSAPEKPMVSELKTTRSCNEFTRYEKITNKTLPICWENKKITSMTNEKDGCLMQYSVGC